MAEKLTPQQEMAVNNRGGSLLVSAAAGSGKTKVLVDRLLSYIMDPEDPANMDDFLIITYTKAAAAELRSKIANKLVERIAENPGNRHLQNQMQRLYLAKISTVHSFCSDILREYAFKLDIPSDFRMAEETECQQLQEQVVEQLLEEIYKNIHQYSDVQMFIDTQGLDRSDKKIPGIILKVFNSARCHLDPDKWLQWCVDSTDTSNMNDASQTPWGQYLIEDLHMCIDLHLDAFTNCKNRLAYAVGMEKVDALIAEDITKLSDLRQCVTWEQIHKHGDILWSDFPKKYDDKELAQKIKAVRDACKTDIKTKLLSFVDCSKQVFADLQNTASAASGLVYLVREFSGSYESIKNRRRILDFADLEHLTLDLLLGKNRSSSTAVAHEISRRFREIMVDEYQDSNAVQDEIFATLTQQKQNCFMVGDVKQSIYQFRLADPSIFLKKYENFSDAERASPGEPRKVVLSQNFRSAGQVISAVNDVFTQCMSPKVGGLVYGKDEKLYEGIKHTALDEPEVELHLVDVRSDTYPEEAAFVADRIRKMLEEKQMIRTKDGFRAVKPEDIVILLRSPGSMGAHYCYALRRLGIRCSMGGSVDLLQTEEVGTLCALLQAISNPLQDIPLAAAVSGRVFCFTADDLAQIRKENRHTSFYHALLRSPMEKVKEFLSVFEDLRHQAKMCSVSQLIEYIFMRTHMDSIFAAMEDGAERTANLQAFCQFAAAYESTGKKDLEQFLEQVEVKAEKGLEVSNEQQPSDCVTVMSIHKSKGLEFPVVFLSGLSRQFSRKSLQEQVLCDRKLGLGLACVDAQQRIRYPSVAKKAIALKIKTESISEEMRVLYVAMTRPKDRLIMTYASPFLKKALTDAAQRIDLSSPLLMTYDVSGPGKWILQTAIHRTEAGQLHAIGGHPDCTAVSENPWLIQIVKAPDTAEDAMEHSIETVDSVQEETVERMKKFLNYQYAHSLAVQAPSKQTATQLKGRLKDQEVSECVMPIKKPKRSYRKPSFVEKTKSGTTYGTAVHKLMQHIDFSQCTDEWTVSEEIARLVKIGHLSQEDADMISGKKIADFFQTEVGKKIRNSDRVLREFKFSILDDGSKYVPGMENEKILLQGVIDCALLEHDGITVIDFKTDRFIPGEEDAVTSKYRMQIMAYADALAEIYQTRTKAAYLYYFHTGKLVPII